MIWSTVLWALTRLALAIAGGLVFFGVLVGAYTYRTVLKGAWWR